MGRLSTHSGPQSDESFVYLASWTRRNDGEKGRGEKGGEGGEAQFQPLGKVELSPEQLSDTDAARIPFLQARKRRHRAVK